MGARAGWGVGVVLAGLLLACGGGYGDGGGGGGTPAPQPSPTTAEVTLTATGLSSTSVRLRPGGQLSFVNGDTRPHQMASNPHPQHTDCPSLNATVLQPGERTTVTAPGEERTCGMHDHLRPDDRGYQLTVTVSQTDVQPGPGQPGY